MKSICVFCGSNPGTNPAFSKQARVLGKLLAEKEITLIYGGGGIGLMGIIADAVLENGGKVTGVIPEFLSIKEVGHNSLTQMIVVKSMHERKWQMSELSDAFIAMPGGIGTLEELAEIFTWSVLALHKKPIGLLNVSGYYDPLLQFFESMVTQRFLHTQNRELVVSAANPESLLPLLASYEGLPAEKWLDRSKF